jgi:DNA (cytosine-5)-methyltransferase 1
MRTQKKTNKTKISERKVSSQISMDENISAFDLGKIKKGKDKNGQIIKAKIPKLGRYEAIAKNLKFEVDKNRKYIKFNENKVRNINFVDLFCGAGGITQGLRQAGFTPVASVEINETASATHERNFPSCKHYCGDIEQYDPKKYVGDKEIHLVVGGPPCQGFSVAGKRDPKDPRNKLFRQFVRIVDELKPHYFVMENVPGILTIENGAVRGAIIEAFQEIGYENISVSILEAAQYGIGQIRTRAIFIGNRKGLPNPFPAPQLTQEQYIPIESVISDLPSGTMLPEINHEWTKHSKAFEDRISRVPPGGSLYETFFDAFKRQYLGVPSMTIKENHGGTHIHPTLNRCISAREMARLQSFPDSFIFEGSMKKAMWQIGNAVPPRLAECIGYALAPFIRASIKGNKTPRYKEVLPISQRSNN